MIQAKNLTKNFQKGEIETKVLRGINLEINQGEYVAITGRSGAGKSTLLYQLGLLDEPTSGEIVIDGVKVADFSESERTQFRLFKLGYIFQDYALLPELTAYENVLVPLLMQARAKKEAGELALMALINVGLEDKKDNLPSQLSGGQQQRVSVARAIASKPKILFADEPTANLDSQTAETVMELLKNLNKQGQTIVLVTHEKMYAKAANRVIEIDDGQIKQSKA